MNILLIGNYGYRNLGDDIFLYILVRYFLEKNTIKKIYIICNKNYYDIKNKKVMFINSKDLSKIRYLLLIIRSRYIIWGGGTLGFNKRPVSLLRIQKLSKLMNKKFGFIGIGINYINQKNKELFEKANFLYVRDKKSYSIALKNLTKNKNIFLGGDLAFLDLSIYPKTKKRINLYPKNISFSGKFWWGGSKAKFYAKQMMKFIKKYNSKIHLIPASMGEERFDNKYKKADDNKFHKKIYEYLPKNNCILHSWNKIDDYLKIINKMDLHFGNRLHSIIIADILGIPNTGIVEDKHKISKIESYIDKHKQLKKERLLDFMQSININKVKKILKIYKKPKRFIINESRTAKECLDKIFD